VPITAPVVSVLLNVVPARPRHLGDAVIGQVALSSSSSSTLLGLRSRCTTPILVREFERRGDLNDEAPIWRRVSDGSSNPAASVRLRPGHDKIHNSSSPEVDPGECGVMQARMTCATRFEARDESGYRRAFAVDTLIATSRSIESLRRGRTVAMPPRLDPRAISYWPIVCP